jgi:hypothetical protein
LRVRCSMAGMRRWVDVRRVGTKSRVHETPLAPSISGGKEPLRNSRCQRHTFFTQTALHRSIVGERTGILSNLSVPHTRLGVSPPPPQPCLAHSAQSPSTPHSRIRSPHDTTPKASLPPLRLAIRLHNRTGVIHADACHGTALRAVRPQEPANHTGRGYGTERREAEGQHEG